MNTKKAYGLVVAVFIILFGAFTLVLTNSYNKNIPNAYAQTVDQKDEEEGDVEECNPEDCGTDNDDAFENTNTQNQPTEQTKQTVPTCTKDTWSCASWTNCSSSGQQTRECTLTDDCASVDTPKPTETNTCTPPAPVIVPVQKPVAPEKVTVPKQEQASEQASEQTAEQAAEKAITLVVENNIGAKQEEAMVKEAKQVPAFKEVIKESSSGQLAPIAAVDVNHNGIPDTVDKLAGQNPQKLDIEDVKLQAQLEVQKQDLIKQGVSSQEAEKQISKTLNQKRAKRKVERIRDVAKTVYRTNIKTNEDGMEKDGISNEVKIALDVDPNAKPTVDGFSLAEMKIYNATKETLTKKCTTNIASGTTLSVKGFTILASCPKNMTYTLSVFDKTGKNIPLETRKSSANSKVVYTIESDVLPPGKYLFQVSPVEIATFNPSNFFNAAITASDTKSKALASDPVLVNLVGTVSLEKPRVKQIENIEITDSTNLSDIKVTAGIDGKIHVTGVSDVNSTVIGTFSSAIFTSAILADVDSGIFSVVSPQALEKGDHEVVIYATNLENAVQSEPVKLSFSIVETANAATVFGNTQPTKKYPWETIAAIAVICLAAVTVVVWKMKKPKKAA